MKNLIIIIGTIVLGSLLFQMMVGDGPNTMKGAVQVAMKGIVALYGEG